MTRDDVVRLLVEQGVDRESAERYVESLSDREISVYSQPNSASATGSTAGVFFQDYSQWQDQVDAQVGAVAEENNISEAEAAEAIDDAEARQERAQEALAEGDVITASIEAGGSTSQWILDRTNGAPVEKEDQDEIIAAYNEASDAPVETWAEFQARVDYGDPTAQQAFDQTWVAGADSFRRVRTPTGELLIRDEYWTAAEDVFRGINNRNFLGRVIATAQRAGVSQGEEDSQWAWLAAVAQANGVISQANRGPGAATSSPTQRALEVAQASPGQRVDAARLAAADSQSRFMQNRVGPERSLNRLTEQWKAAQVRYGDPALALIATVDRDLAEAIFENGEASAEEAQRVNEIFLRAGVSRENFARMGVYIDEMKWAALTTPGFASGGGGGNTATVTLPDRESVRQSMKSMWNSWFGRDPSEDEVASFASSIEGAMRAEGARKLGQLPSARRINVFKGETPPDPQNVLITAADVDADARQRRLAQSLPEYRRLFGKKDSGLTEEEYMAQFEMAASSLFGSSYAAKWSEKSAGMETGNVQTTMGQLAGSSAALDNSTFRQRMARAASVFARNT